jgi:hypothetical protein
MAVPLVACTRTMELVDLKTGATLTGTHRLWTRTISVTLPTGETAVGTTTPLTTAELGPDSLFFGANAGELLGPHATDRLYGYAKLTGAQGTVVELIFAADWLGHGYGVARTSLDEEYRVTF